MFTAFSVKPFSYHASAHSDNKFLRGFSRYFLPQGNYFPLSRIFLYLILRNVCSIKHRLNNPFKLQYYLTPWENHFPGGRSVFFQFNFTTEKHHDDFYSKQSKKIL